MIFLVYKNQQKVGRLFNFFFSLVLIFILHVPLAAAGTPEWVLDGITGGDCNLIGTWDSGTKTCTLTTDIVVLDPGYDGIDIGGDGITLDGNGHKISGPDNCGSGVTIFSQTSNTVKNLLITQCTTGIQVSGGSAHSLSDNTIYGTMTGVDLSGTTGNYVYRNLIARTSSYGVFLSSSNGNYIGSSTCALGLCSSEPNTFFKSDAGIYLLGDSNGIISNYISNNNYGILISGNSNTAYGNLFFDNATHAAIWSGTGNAFYYSVPFQGTSGNYWKNYHTPAQGCNDLNLDYTCDAPYVYPSMVPVQDNYPYTDGGWAFATGLYSDYYADTFPATTSHNAPAGWMSSDISVDLTCTDPSYTRGGFGDPTHNGSGCEYIQYRIDSGSWTMGYFPASDRLNFSTEGDHLIEFYSVDYAGNVESTKSAHAKIDKTPPASGNNAPAGWQNANFDVFLSCTDALSGCSSTHYEVDGGGYSIGNTVSITTGGDHTINYYSVDNATNSESLKSMHAKLDKTAPLVSSILPSGTINDVNPTVSAAYSDDFSDINTSSASLTLDGGALGGCTITGADISCPASGLLAGPHTIGGSISDNAGNTGAISGGFTIVYLPVRLAGLTPSYFSNIQTAYSAAAGGNVIEAKATQFSGALLLDRPISVTLKGGYNAEYSANSSMTDVEGPIDIAAGTLTMENISITVVN